MTLSRSLIVATLCLSLRVASATAQTGDNILLVTNALSQNSDEIGRYYARKRTVPTDNILNLPLPIAEEISRRDYETKIERPLAEWIVAKGAEDRILYILLTKDVPLRIAGDGGPGGTVASVDSELTLLYRKLYGIVQPTAGSIKNPYFSTAAPGTAPSRFSHRTHDIYLVGRLDGYSVDDVKALIDRGASPVHEGTIVLDGKLELSDSIGNRWLQAAADSLKRLPGWSNRVVIDTGQHTLTSEPNVIGFYTWGSNAVAATERHFGHHFVPGAIAGEYVSTDARTFKEPPADWVVNNTKNPFGGSHQSLIGDLIRDGITGVAGHVAEPYLNATIRPDMLFPAYVSGLNLIESFYTAMPALSWQTVVIGDPLCSPFTDRSAATTDARPSTDPDTELPQFFSARRVAVLVASGTTPEAAKWLARSEARAARKDSAGVRDALERATTIDPQNAQGNMALALMYDQMTQWDAAIDRYRRVLSKVPNQIGALNNLAYSLSTHKNNSAEALPLALRAYSLSNQDPIMGDTLAWVQHLMNNDAVAEPTIEQAAKRLPGIPDVQLHAAFIFNATGKRADAARYLEAAINLDASLAERDDVKALALRVRTPQ